MRSTLPVLILTAFATSVFAIEQITATESAACSAAECTSCEKGCECDKPCCQKAESAAAKATSQPVTASAVLTASTTTICGEKCGAGQCACCKNEAEAATACTPPTSATWTAATSEFAFVTDALAESSACCNGQGQCTAACCNNQTERTSACAAELQRTGLDPYRIEPPDVLTVYLPELEVTCSEMKQELTACGALTDAQLPFTGKKTEAIVQPDGRISIGNIGSIYVAGMTVEEAEQAICKQAITAHPQAARVPFGVFVNVSGKNSKKAYIILEGGSRGDNVSAVPATANSTVSSVLQNCAWPQPIDFAAARIWISRPAGNSGSGETILPVTWNVAVGQPTCESNHAVLPGDRLFVKTSTEPAIPVPPLPVAEAPVMPHPVRYYVPTPEGPQAYPSIGFDAVANVPVMRYSAIPAAAPSPFSHQLSVIQASPVFTALPPLPQPPEPSTQPACAASCANSTADSWERDGKNVEFTIAVIEDVSGSFAEFPKLRDGLIMVSDSGPTLAAVRIMENQKLVKRISNPQIRCVVGEQTTFCLASACECQSEGSETESLSVQVKAQDPTQSANGSQMFIETGVQTTRGRQIRQIQLAYRIEEGQTAILKTRHEPRPSSTDEEHAVYVVVTPKLVK